MPILKINFCSDLFAAFSVALMKGKSADSHVVE